MNPGLAEEGGKVATGVIDALKAQPAVLALTLAQVAMLVFLFYALNEAGKFRASLLKQQFDYQHEISLILSKCIVPTKEQ